MGKHSKYGWSHVYDDAVKHAAYHVDTQRELFRASRRIKNDAQKVLTEHREEGHAIITMRRYKLDWYISLDDTNSPSPAAAAIEFGSKYPLDHPKAGWQRSVPVAPLRKAISMNGVNLATRRSFRG